MRASEAFLADVGGSAALAAIAPDKRNAKIRITTVGGKKPPNTCWAADPSATIKTNQVALLSRRAAQFDPSLQVT
jgi:hypothetical protein